MSTVNYSTLLDNDEKITAYPTDCPHRLSLPRYDQVTKEQAKLSVRKRKEHQITIQVGSLACQACPHNLKTTLTKVECDYAN